MKSTSRLRVLSDRIPRVLVFVYFCRGLSGNMEERPTRRDYVKILTCCQLSYIQKTPEATRPKRRRNGARPRAPALVAWAPAPLLEPNQDSFVRDIPPTYWIKKNIVPPRLSTQKRIEGEDYISKAPLAPGEDMKKLSQRLRGALEGKPLL